MTADPVADQRASVRRALSLALVAALCIAALTAIAAILSGDFDDTDVRVIGTSLGFGVFSATAASGGSLRFRQSVNLRMLGLATMALSAVSFLLFCGAIWIDSEDDAWWQWFGCAGLATLASSHASLVTGALRDGDTPAIRGLTTASVALGTVDASFGILAISEAVDSVDVAVGQLVAVLVILLLLTTALPPILRRLQRTPAAPAARAQTPRLQHTTEIMSAIDHIEALNADPGNHAPEIRRECERLRQLMRAYDG